MALESTHPRPAQNLHTHTGSCTSKESAALLLTLLKLTVLFQAVPACSIKVYGPRRAFKGKGGSAIHSCGGGGRYSHERLHMEIFRWDNVFTRHANNSLAVCLCGSSKWEIPVILFSHLLKKVVAGWGYWRMRHRYCCEALCELTVLLFPHTVCRTNAYVKLKFLNNMSEMIRIIEKESQS